jgi:hypothetical protein
VAESVEFVSLNIDLSGSKMAAISMPFASSDI